jgi:hypothetical protein
MDSLIGATLGWQYYAYGGAYEPGGGGSGSFTVNGPPTS